LTKRDRYFSVARPVGKAASEDATAGVLSGPSRRRKMTLLPLRQGPPLASPALRAN